MKISALAAAVTCDLMILLTQGLAAEAAEVTVLSAAALRPVMHDLGPQCERTTGHKLAIQFDVVGVLKRQIDAGELFIELLPGRSSEKL